MTNSNQIQSVGGTADGALTSEEIKAQLIIPKGNTLFDLGQSIINKVEWASSSYVNTVKATKYPTDPTTIYLGRGAFTFNYILGRYIFSTSSSEPTDPLFKIDQQKSILRSSANKTTIGSKNIDTKDGFLLNQVGAKYPSTHFTPQKTWVKTLFPALDDELLSVAMLEAISFLILNSLRGTKSEQIVKQSPTTISTQIVDNQEIEDMILQKARS